jgi:hypothetical protein
MDVGSRGDQWGLPYSGSVGLLLFSVDLELVILNVGFGV